jgi:hypothetical protein
MGKQIIYNDPLHELMRKQSKEYYHNGNGKKSNRLRYLMERNGITKKDLIDMETLEEKLDYCNKIHIQKKYNIELK